MSSSASDAPFGVANLCSNCQKVQFRDDIPELYQSGPHLELDEEQLPKHRRGERTGGSLPTEFVLIDSYPELPKLWKSSQDGCDFCRFLHEAIASFVSEDSDINKMSGCIMSISIAYSWAMLYGDGREGSREFPNGLDAMLIAADFASHEIGDNKITLKMVCHVESACESDAVSRWLRLRNRSNQEYCDADSVQWMKQTLERCVKSHGHDVFDHAYMPERLIDVRPEMPRLILREDHMQSAVSTLKYAALSYCWGSGESQAKTNVATLSDRQAGITETELPPAIRDAIQVTRALGIPFLWVDALCIVQDDPSDWQRQCTEMHNIYGSAQVTLCATNSRSCDEGFLRQTGRIIRIPFQSRRTPHTEGFFLVQYKGHTTSYAGKLGSAFIYTDTQLSRWSSRGWIFQETILSTRRLIFGASDLHFLCSKCRQRRGQDAITHGYDRHIGKSEIDGDPIAIYETWNAVIGNYSSYKTGSFTNATDILPALSGLARLLYGRLKDDYYAGHWRRHLYSSLLWCEGDPHTHSEPFWSASLSGPRSEAFIVPSWSSLNKGYTFGIFRDDYEGMNGWYDCRSEINLLKANVLMTGANPFGALTGCSLRLRGYTLDLSHKEVEISGASWPEYSRRESHSLMVYGRCFGTLSFDCKPKPHDQGGKCVSEGELGRLKLLLLMRCDYSVPEVTPTNSDSEWETITEDSSSEEESRSEEEPGEREHGKIECSGEAISDQQQKGRGEYDSRDDIQSQQINMQGSLGRTFLKAGDIVRKGFGLILCPTGNDGEFYRVGMFSPVSARSLYRGSTRSLLGDLGGDIRELQSLAQVETVELV